MVSELVAWAQIVQSSAPGSTVSCRLQSTGSALLALHCCLCSCGLSTGGFMPRVYRCTIRSSCLQCLYASVPVFCIYLQHPRCPFFLLCACVYRAYIRAAVQLVCRTSACLHICMSVKMSACPHVYLPAHLSVRLFPNLSLFLSAVLSVPFCFPSVPFRFFSFMSLSFCPSFAVILPALRGFELFCSP